LLVNDSEDFVRSALSSRQNTFEPQQQDVDYNAPVQDAVLNQPIIQEAAMPLPKDGEAIKLANYGYDSDSSPDTNSNILKIGHANNKLEDGVSAALTKSLAQRYGLKTGDFFEITTADGKTMKRRYDDTVPRSYRGKSLPETVDLYERGGSNKFGGKVVEIKPLK
jgi:bifunctional DNA-binding transcriptional regulator/antitoxin component of YhaV-PrlF toxin-antitoxin module